MSGRARRATRPTPCLFDATLGLRADYSRLTRACGHRARGGLALRLAGARLGKDPGSGRCAKGKQQHWQGIASYEGKAAPTRATLQRVQPRFDGSQRSGAEKSLDRKIERNEFLPFWNFEFQRIGNLSKLNFRKFPIPLCISVLKTNMPASSHGWFRLTSSAIA
jgi:hypothetical protein